MPDAFAFPLSFSHRYLHTERRRVPHASATCSSLSLTQSVVCECTRCTFSNKSLAAPSYPAPSSLAFLLLPFSFYGVRAEPATSRERGNSSHSATVVIQSRLRLREECECPRVELEGNSDEGKPTLENVI